MAYNDTQYTKLAKAIVDDFVEREIALKAGVIKTANELSLNAHETRRLIETTNVHAHLTLFNKMADSRYVEFEIADPQEICDAVFGGDSGAASTSTEKVAHEDSVADLYAPLPNERHLLKIAAYEKTASDTSVLGTPPPTHGKYDGNRAYATLSYVNKVAAELESELRQRNFVYKEAVERFAEPFRLLGGPDHSAFEKCAFSRYGRRSANALQKLRLELRLPIADSFEKTAEVVLVKTAELEAFAEVLSAYDAVCVCADGMIRYKERAAQLLR